MSHDPAFILFYLVVRAGPAAASLLCLSWIRRAEIPLKVCESGCTSEEDHI